MPHRVMLERLSQECPASEIQTKKSALFRSSAMDSQLGIPVDLKLFTRLMPAASSGASNFGS